MYCDNCGHPISDGARFCENCGGPVVTADTDQPEQDIKIEGHKVTENIFLCPDGKYRWIYEYQMLKNPTILITVMKVLLLSFGIVLGFMTLINLLDGSFRYWNQSDFLSFYSGFFILLCVILVLGAVSYLILAAIYGRCYQVLFTMDEDGVELMQMKKDFRRTQAIGWLTAAAGLATGNIGRIGTGILAATRNSSSSVFEHVRKVKSVRRRHVIYVNQLLGHNQVYAGDADFDFVRNYILEHCPNAKITG